MSTLWQCGDGAWRKGSRIFALVLTLGLSTAYAPSTLAEGRLVGILFDDSGSMKGRIQLPAFGAQMLVSSLDGAVGRDRLFTIRLSSFEDEVSKPNSTVGRLVREQQPKGYSQDYIRALVDAQAPGLPKREQIATPQDQQRTIEAIRDDWPKARSDTPYEPLEILLEQLAREAQSDQDIFLIVLTDGAFDRGSAARPGPRPDHPPEEYLKRVYAEYNSRTHGRLRVEFLLIVPADRGGDELRDKVKKQKVRETLLTAFNKSPTDGSQEVSSVPQMVVAIQKIIARVSATDRADSSDIASQRDNSLNIRSPFSVSRLISIANGALPGGPPTIVGSSFNRAADMTFESSMKLADRARGWENEQQAATTTHFRFSPPHPAGDIALRFNRAPGANVLFLFQTEARFDLRVRDQGGTLVQPNTDGSLTLLEKRPYWVEGWLTDRDPAGSGSRAVPFAMLPASARFAAAVSGGNLGRAAVDLRREDARNHATGSMTLPMPGQYTLTGAFSLPGFVSKQATARQLRVQSADVSYSIDVRSVTACPTCGTQEVRFAPRDLRALPHVAEVRIAQASGLPSSARLSLETAPDFLVLTDRDGKNLGRSVELDLASGQARDFRLMIAEGHRAPPGRAAADLRLTLVAAEPLSGRAMASSRLTTEMPDVKIHYIGNSRGAPLDQPLRLSGEALSGGRDFLRFRVENLPPDARREDIRITGESSLLTVTRRDGAEDVELFPRQRWCTCITWLLGAPDAIGLEVSVIAGEPPSAAQGPFAFEPTLRERGISCGMIVLAVTALCWALAAAYLYKTAFRFPKTSHMEIVQSNTPLPDNAALKGSKLRLLQAALLLRRAHERALVRGLHLEARPSGAVLRIRESDPDVRVIDQACSLKDIMTNNPRLIEQFFPWGSRFSRAKTEKMMTLKRA